MTDNSDHWSYVIFIGIEYLINHIVSTKFAIDIAILSSYCVILNHPVTGSMTGSRPRFHLQSNYLVCIKHHLFIVGIGTILN